MNEEQRIPWKPIEPLDVATAPSNGAFAALEALRREWQRYQASLQEDERLEIRRRSLRRLAIETGILERLYDVDWGLTRTLVAEGFARDVVERRGDTLDEQVLATLRAQRDALDLVVDFASAQRSLGTGFIKELHHALTRTQATYTATDALGRTFQRELAHGDWKRDPNHVLLANGRLLEYAPPEHVAAEMDRLVALFAELEQTHVHPLVKAAWLHHRFVQIHPFADGNGRVARALVLLVMQRHHYAPLVVDRFHRDDYLRALDQANAGDLGPFVRLCIRLESAALVSELERPQRVEAGVALQVAHTLAAQLKAARERQRSDVRAALDARAVAIGGHMQHWFSRKEADLRQVFNRQGLFDVRVKTFTELPPSDKARWFRRQIIEAAHTMGHYADLSGYAGYSQLRIRLGAVELRYVATLHGVGRDPGVMAVVTFGLLDTPAADSEAQTDAGGESFPTSYDAFRFVAGESIDDLEKRVDELHELLDQGLSVALLKLQDQV
jgi:Fic family protein